MCQRRPSCLSAHAPDHGAACFVGFRSEVWSSAFSRDGRPSGAPRNAQEEVAACPRSAHS